MYPNPPFALNEAPARDIDDSGDIPLPRRDRRPDRRPASTVMRWWWTAVGVAASGFGLSLAVTIMYASLTRETPLAQDTSALVLRGLTACLFLAAVIATVAAFQVRTLERGVDGIRAHQSAPSDMHAAVAAGQQLQAVSSRIAGALREVAVDRAADTKGREVLDKALIGGVSAAVGKPLEAITERLAAVERGLAATMTDLTHRVDRFEVTTRQTSVDHAERLAVLEKKESDELAEAPVHPPASTAQWAADGGMPGGGNGKVDEGSAATIVAMPHSEAVDLGRRLERKKWTNGNGDQRDEA